MVLIREASLQDIVAICDLFNSDPQYQDSYFNTGSRSIAEERLLSLQIKLVAVSNEQIIGFMGAQDFSDGVQGKVIERIKLFVHPDYRGVTLGQNRGERISDVLSIAMNERLDGYDAVVGSVVCGHTGSQLLVFDERAPTAFSPLWLKQDQTNRGQRESAILSIKYLNPQFEADIFSPKTIYVHDKVRDVVEETYRLLGLRDLRTMVTELDKQTESSMLRADGFDNIEQAREEYGMQLDQSLAQRGDLAALPVLDHLELNLTNPHAILRAELEMKRGEIPVGVLPLKTDRLLMQPVLKGIPFDYSKVSIVEQVRPLVEMVGELYNASAYT